MLTLALLRHAKSSWDDPAADDFDRPLNARGELAAPLMGERMIAHGFKPDLILSSPAKRARQTLERIKSTIADTNTVVRFDNDIYLASADTLLSVIKQQGGDASHVLLIGHNPGLHILAIQLSAVGDRQIRAQLAEKFPTAALAIFDFDCSSWSAIGHTPGRLTAYMTPKQS